VALSADGSLLAVGSPGEASDARGAQGNQDNQAAMASGAVYVFSGADAWVQQSYLKAPNSAAMLGFGASLSVSADGKRIAIGAPNENGGSEGVNGDQTNQSALRSGAVYVFTR
jgi:hypothetical protein